MGEPRLVTFYLNGKLRRQAAARRHNFIARITGVLEGAGFEVAFERRSRAALMSSAGRPGYAMFHMDDPFHERALTMRRVYAYPFWAIERTAKRWDWPVARERFPAAEVPRQEADRFCAFWRKRLFGDTAASPRREGFVYVPLQGRLSEHRSFQTCTPLEMIERVLEHDHRRPVVATLHPKERYTEAELAALEALAARYPRLSLRTGGMEPLLAGCDYVVTQNSSAAFFGFFFGKPAALFAQIDFHHIAANAAALGAEEALALAPGLAPDYAGYLHWFWQRRSVNAGRPEADAQIAARLRAAGWPV